MNFHRIKQFKKLILSAFLCLGLIVTAGLNAYSAPSAAEDYLTLAEERKSLPIQSNHIDLL